MADALALPTLRDAGSAGTITLRGDRLCVSAGETIEMVVDLEAAYQTSYTAALAHFVAALRTDQPFETAPEAHLQVLQTVEDVYRHAAGESP